MSGRSAGVALLVLVGTAAAWRLLARDATPAAYPGRLLTNEEVIEELGRELDLSDARAVFRFVFERLDDEVRVYPSQNHYYLRFWAAGHAISGSLALAGRDRDDGVLGFGYVARPERGAPRAGPALSGGGSLSAADGVLVTRRSDHLYDVTFEGRTVRFRLNDDELAPPPDERLAEGETYVAPVLDESGLRFHLLFAEPDSHLFLVLDESEGVAESFRRLSDDVVVGWRTAFAFFDDDDRGRRVLIGVAAESVLADDWHDGPFDQMPDNLVHRGRIPAYRRYVEASYPAARGRIDRYGHFHGEPGARVVVAPYLVYETDEDLLATVAACEAEGRGSGSFTTCLTQQVFPQRQGGRR